MKTFKANVTWSTGDGIIAGTAGPLKWETDSNINAIIMTIGWCQRQGVENVTSIKVEEV